ncbi:MAG: hypothetical protein ACI8UO_003673 [Verrucomicrobiales bacterium]|jgi:hypothetical protein
MAKNPLGEGRLQSVSRRILIIPMFAILVIAPSACHRGSPSSGGYESSWETVHYGNSNSFHESSVDSYSSSNSNDNEAGDSEYHEQQESHDKEYWEDQEKHD